MSTQLIDRDEDWKPCVGRSPTGGSAPFVSSDRAEMAQNRAWPMIHYIALTKTDPQTHNARVRMRINLSYTNYTTPVWSWLPAASGEEHYGVKLTVHQGNLVEDPLFAITRKMIDPDGASMSIVARTYLCYWKYPFNGYYYVDEQSLFAPEGLSAAGLGLTTMQVCVNDYYGDCGPTVPTQHPQTYFYATWPRSPSLTAFDAEPCCRRGRCNRIEPNRTE